MSSICFDHFLENGEATVREFEQTTFHTHDYIRRRWAEHLRLISIESRAILGRHDAILCTKKQ